MRLIVTGSSFIKTIATFVHLAGHWWHVEVGKGSATAAANSFQARKGATGVIGHNLVDSLIYKQSLMKFLVFINNALQPRAPVCRHRYPGIPRCLSLSLSLSLPLFTTPFYTLPFSCSYRFRATRTIVRHPLSSWLSTYPRSLRYQNIPDESTCEYVTHCHSGTRFFYWS